MKQNFKVGYLLSFENLVTLGCREFVPRVTMSQIIDNLNDRGIKEFLSWGVDRKIGVIKNDDDEVVGMMLKLDHKNYGELIYITLNWSDYYNIYFIRQSDNELLNMVEDVMCDELFSVIHSSLESVIKFEFNQN